MKLGVVHSTVSLYVMGIRGSTCILWVLQLPLSHVNLMDLTRGARGCHRRVKSSAMTFCLPYCVQSCLNFEDSTQTHGKIIDAQSNYSIGQRQLYLNRTYPILEDFGTLNSSTSLLDLHTVSEVGFYSLAENLHPNVNRQSAMYDLFSGFRMRSA